MTNVITYIIIYAFPTYVNIFQVKSTQKLCFYQINIGLFISSIIMC